MPLADLTYLVVEDDEFQRRWLVAMLTSLGAVRVIQAADGLQALRRLQDPEQGIDICFIDLNMPGMDGLELIRHMAGSASPASVILASALDPALVFSVESMSHAYGVNMLGTIVKPATPESLATLIARHVPPASRQRGAALTHETALEEILQGLQDDQFTPYFQPKVALATGKVSGVEAFARWEHPLRGTIGPADFIPLLEKNRRIDLLTWHIIRKSAATARALRDAGHALPISVNVAAQSLSEFEFAEHFSACLAAQGIDNSALTIEITESATAANLPVFLENLARLRMKGFVLAVDDFGTGDAGVQHHLRIPFSEIKIDRSFVTGAAHNETLRLALGASLELAHKLGRESTAVGVETRENWDLLHELGCTSAQGYYIARPMAYPALLAWLEEWSQFF